MLVLRVLEWSMACLGGWVAGRFLGQILAEVWRANRQAWRLATAGSRAYLDQRRPTLSHWWWHFKSDFCDFSYDEKRIGCFALPRNPKEKPRPAR